MKNNAVSKIRLLKDIQPNPDWLKSQRSNLLFEISQSGNKAKSAWKLPAFILPTRLLARHDFAFKPVLVSLTLFGLIFGGGFLGVLASKDSLPGDLLYPIKIAIENTQVKVSSQENKPKLQAEFVGTRVDELTQVIEEPVDPDNPIKRKEKVVRAVDKLQAQVISAKAHLDKIKEEQPERVVEAVEAISEKTAIVKQKLVEEFSTQGGPVAGWKDGESEEIIKVLDAAVAIITGTAEAGIEIQHEVIELKEVPVEELPVISPSISFEEIYDE